MTWSSNFITKIWRSSENWMQQHSLFLFEDKANFVYSYIIEKKKKQKLGSVVFNWIDNVRGRYTRFIKTKPTCCLNKKKILCSNSQNVVALKFRLYDRLNKALINLFFVQLYACYVALRSYIITDIVTSTFKMSVD